MASIIPHLACSCTTLKTRRTCEEVPGDLDRNMGEGMACRAVSSGAVIDVLYRPRERRPDQTMYARGAA